MVEIIIKAIAIIIVLVVMHSVCLPILGIYIHTPLVCSIIAGFIKALLYKVVKFLLNKIFAKQFIK